MASLDEFKALPIRMRSYALVGRYLQCWAFMEGKLNDALGKVLGIEGLKLLVVVRNIQLRDKIHIVKCALTLQRIPTAEVEQHQKLLERIGNLSKDRNMMAHDIFAGDADSEGVRFIVAKAKKSIQLPDTVWKVEKFFSAYDEMHDIHLKLWDLEKRLEAVQLEKLLSESAPTLGIGGLGLLGSHSRPLPNIPGSSLWNAIPETDDQTDPSSQE